jgi:glutaminyl-tRNA synthetase
LRRRGYTPEAMRTFCEEIGVAKFNSTVDVASSRTRSATTSTARAARMAVLDPLKLVIDELSRGPVEELDAVNNPEDPRARHAQVPFSRELYIERDDFREEAPRSTSASSPGRRCGCATPTT